MRMFCPMIYPYPLSEEISINRAIFSKERLFWIRPTPLKSINFNSSSYSGPNENTNFICYPILAQIFFVPWKKKHQYYLVSQFWSEFVSWKSTNFQLVAKYGSCPISVKFLPIHGEWYVESLMASPYKNLMGVKFGYQLKVCFHFLWDNKEFGSKLGSDLSWYFLWDKKKKKLRPELENELKFVLFMI